jgi:hypothetical protein
LFEVQPVLPSGIKKRNLYDRSQQRPSKPWTGVEGLAKAVVSDLAEGGEWRLGGNGAEASFRSQRLSQLRCAHRFSQTDSPKPKMHPG